MVVFACVLLGAQPAAAAEKGVVPDLTWGTSRADVDRTVDLMRSAGVRWVRTNVSWSGGEPTEGRLNEGWLADVDYAVDAARRAGIEVLMPISDGVPYWASADPAKHVEGNGTLRWNKYYRPSNPDQYARFVRAIVDRYKVRGVRAYEIWNEPNLTRFWPSGPSPAEYLAILRPAHAAVKASDPGATVLLGGFSKSDYGYLQRLYDLGARPYFDAVAVHPYTTTDPTLCWQGSDGKPSLDAFCAIEEVRATMVRNGDSSKELWLTEYGWSSSPLAPWSVDEARQADYVAKALAWLDRVPYVSRAFYYGFRNVWWARDDARDWEANLGLLRTDFSPKPAFFAFRDYKAGSTAAGGAPAPAATPSPAPATAPSPGSASSSSSGSTPAAVAAAPVVRLASPAPGAVVGAKVTLSAEVSGSAERVEFRVDGRLVAVDRSAPFRATVGKLRRGSHVVGIVAVSASGGKTALSSHVVRR